MKRLLTLVCLFPVFAALAQVPAPSSTPLRQLHDIGIDQRLGSQVPLDIPFRNEDGSTVSLRSFFGTRPVLLVPVYYTCPMLCSQILSGVVAGLRPVSMVPGRDFEVVAFSFNPTETPQDANAARTRYTQLYSHRGGTQGWHFLTGPQASIDVLTRAIGFHYRYDPASKVYLHASGVMVLTPQGKLARYFYGVEYEPKDLRLGLLEASQRRITSPVDQILLFCYHYDPTTGRYGSVVLNALRGAAAATLLLLAGLLGSYWRADLRRYHVIAEGDKP